jgi:outer membrane protein TolC
MRPKHPLYHALTATALLVAAPAGLAEESTPALPDRLTEEMAVRWAEQHNDRVLDARSRVQERHGERIESRSWLPSSPRVGLGADVRQVLRTGNLDATLSLRQEFWFGGKRNLTMRIAEAHLGAQRRNLSRTRTLVAAEARSAFYELLADREADSGLEGVTERLRTVARRLENREGGSAEHRMAVNQARIAYARARAELASARKQREQSRLQLLEVLAVSPPQPTQVKGTIPNRPLAIPAQETLLTRSLRQRSDLEAAEQDVDAVQQERRLVGRQVVPNPSVSMQYRTEDGANIGGFGLSMNLPSFAGIRGSRRQANARLEQAQRRRDALRRQIRRQVLQGIADYRAARRQLAALSPRVQDRARTNLHLLEEAAQQGDLEPGRIGSVLESFLALRTARQQALQDLITAAEALEKATGGLVVMGQYQGPDN